MVEFRFLGESAPELKGLTVKERRKRYFQALRSSYLRLKTWLGFVLFLSLILFRNEIAEGIYFILDKNIFEEKRTMEHLTSFLILLSLICLGGFQYSAIRDELKKKYPQPSH